MLGHAIGTIDVSTHRWTAPVREPQAGLIDLGQPIADAEARTAPLGAEITIQA